jgi:GNAT superfamily N-acetyltransferase
MVEGFRFIEITCDKDQTFNLGKYTEPIAIMQGMLLSKYELGICNNMNDLIETLHEESEDWVAALVVLNKTDEAVAYASLSTVANEQNEMELSYAYVHRGYRGLGIYKQLLNHRLEIARRYGITEVRMQLLEDAVLKPFITREGFKEVESINGPIYKKKLDQYARVGDELVTFYQPSLF